MGRGGSNEPAKLDLATELGKQRHRVHACLLSSSSSMAALGLGLL